MCDGLSSVDTCKVWGYSFDDATSYYGVVQKPRPGAAIVIGAALLNALPIVLATSLLPRYLGLVGLAMALIHFFAMQHIRGVGSKII